MEYYDHSGSGMYGELLFPISSYHLLMHMEASMVMGITEIELRIYYQVYPGPVLEIVSGTQDKNGVWEYVPIGRFKLSEAFHTGLLETYLRRFILECQDWLGLGYIYYESHVISERRFRLMMDDIMADLQLARYSTMKRWGDTSLIRYCRAQGLDIHPTPEDGYLDCKCPAGNHRFTLDAVKSRWWCGYCRKKGGINELSDQVEFWRTKHG